MLRNNLVLVLVLLLVGTALAEDAAAAPNSDRGDFKKSLSRDCANDYSITCLKLDLVSWVDKLNEDDDVSVLPGVSLVRENGSARSNTADIVAELARDFPDDPDARLDVFLLKKFTGYLNSHSVKLNLMDDAGVGEARRRGGGGGGGGKGGGGMGYILAAAAMMKATLGALALGGLAAIAGKALMTGLIALLLSTIIGIKSLAHHGGGHNSYEVISKPVYTHSSIHEEHGGHGGHSSYGRSFDGDLPLPLGLQDNYKPPQ